MGKEDDRKIRILMVDDNLYDRVLFGEILEKEGYELAYASTMEVANQAVRGSLKDGVPFEIALVDLNLAPLVTGAALARRIKDFVPETWVMILTGGVETVADLCFEPDGVVIKGSNAQLAAQSIINAANGLLQKPRRHSGLSLSTKLRLLGATEGMWNMNSLKFLTCEYAGPSRECLSEKLTLQAVDPEKRDWVNCVVYPFREGDDVVVCSIQTTVGCNQNCACCLYRSHQSVSGLAVRVLSASEIVAQIYNILVHSQIMRTAFRSGKNFHIELRLTGQGDGLINNLSECTKAIWQLAGSGIFSFLLSSPASEKSVEKLISECLDGPSGLPRTGFSWTVYSLKSAVREKIVPGSKGCSIPKLLSLWEVVAQKLGIIIDAVFPLFEGVNDGIGDAKEDAAFFQDRPFRIVLIAGCSEGYSGCLSGASSTPRHKVEAFRQWLLKAGMKAERVVIRETFGSGRGEFAGLGQTKPNFPEKKE